MPETLNKEFLEPYVVEPLVKSEFFPDEFDVKRPFWILYGRPGLRKGRTVYQELLKYDGLLTIYIDVPKDNTLHKMKMMNLVGAMNAFESGKIEDNADEFDKGDNQKRQMMSEPLGMCVVLDHGYRLMRSSDLQVVELFRELIPNIKKRVTIICCSDIPSAQIPEDFRILCQLEGQHYYTCPSAEWRQVYFEKQIENYRTFVESRPEMRHIRVDMTPIDIITLKEASEFCTVLDIQRFCSQLFNAVHTINPDHPRVLDLDLCKKFLRNVGGCYVLLEGDPQRLEQTFEQCAGVGYTDPDRRTSHSITDIKLYESTTGRNIDNFQYPSKSDTQYPSDTRHSSKFDAEHPEMITSTKRFVFGPSGEEIDLGSDKDAPYIQEEEIYDTFTKPITHTKKQKTLE